MKDKTELQIKQDMLNRNSEIIDLINDIKNECNRVTDIIKALDDNVQQMQLDLQKMSN